MEGLRSKLQSFGYTVNAKGHIFKYSEKTRRKEIAGQINNAGVYFYAQNVAPFVQGQNTFSDILGGNSLPKYVPFIPKQKVREHEFTFSDYHNTTKSKNQFHIFLKEFHKKIFSKPLEENIYDIRGVKSGYLEDATLFPYINYDNEFTTAKIVKYNTSTGKRVKKNFSNSWFHAYKPIKQELGIQDKLSRNGSCFFGEHLLPFNNKPVVIVEAEKTAILLSFLYKETVFLATGGLTNLNSLDFHFLANRKVFLFPDNGASEWFSIAEERGWFCSDILEVYGSNGNDVIDYLETKDTNGNSKAIYIKVDEQLSNINAGLLDISEIECNSLSLQSKSKLSFNYCIPNLQELGLNYYWDNSKGKYFKGNNFKIYDADFQYLNANIDFNKQFKTEFGWQQMDSEAFIKRLEKCFRITKYLNIDKPYLNLFSHVLYHLNQNSNHTFNVRYVERVLVPLWDKDKNDITKYIKTRNWTFAGNKGLQKDEFLRELNNDKRLSKTNKHLKALSILLDKKEFIHTSAVGLDRESDNVFVWGLIKKYNKEIIGSTTYRSYKNKLEISKYLNFCIEKHNVIYPENKLYIKLCRSYSTSNIDCTKICTTFKMPSNSIISDNTGVHRKFVKEYFSFKPNRELLIDLKTLVNYYIEHPQDFHFNRANKYIEVIPNKTVKEINTLDLAKEINLLPADAFDYELDLSNSVLNCSIEEAYNMKNGFLIDWFRFHYPNLTYQEIEIKISEYSQQYLMAS